MGFLFSPYFTILVNKVLVDMILISTPFSTLSSNLSLFLWDFYLLLPINSVFSLPFWLDCYFCFLITSLLIGFLFLLLLRLCVLICRLDRIPVFYSFSTPYFHSFLTIGVSFLFPHQLPVNKILICTPSTLCSNLSSFSYMILIFYSLATPYFHFFLCVGLSFYSPYYFYGSLIFTLNFPLILHSSHFYSHNSHSFSSYFSFFLSNNIATLTSSSAISTYIQTAILLLTPTITPKLTPPITPKFTAITP